MLASFCSASANSEASGIVIIGRIIPYLKNPVMLQNQSEKIFVLAANSCAGLSENISPFKSPKADDRFLNILGIFDITLFIDERVFPATDRISGSGNFDITGVTIPSLINTAIFSK